MDDLRWLSERLSSQARAIAAGVIVVAWGLLITPQTAPGISRAWLLFVCGLALMTFLIDMLQYSSSYWNDLRTLRRMERGERFAGYPPRHVGFRQLAFAAKLVVAVLTFGLFVGVVGTGLYRGQPTLETSGTAAREVSAKDGV